MNEDQLKIFWRPFTTWQKQKNINIIERLPGSSEHWKSTAILTYFQSLPITPKLRALDNPKYIS